MTGTVRGTVASGLLVIGMPLWTEAQTFEGVGTRAHGMAAFVAVADDASAVYWNPAGLASGAYFSLVLDRTEAETMAAEGRGGQRSSWLLALSAPALGLSYYRLRSSAFRPSATGGPDASEVDSLVTHHAGATLVQTIVQGVAVGTTLKLVRGIASSGMRRADPENLLDDLELGLPTNRFDLDVGVMMTGRVGNAGLSFRNLVEPEFETLEGNVLRLNRQARAGVAVRVTDRWTAAADIDLTRNRGPMGDVRAFAIGTEGRLTSRAFVRGGVQVNTAGGDGRTPVVTLGGSYAALGSLLIDAHFSTGSESAFTGWGVAGRVVF